MLTESEKPLNITASPNLSVLSPATQIHKINWFDRECGYSSCIAQWHEGDSVFVKDSNLVSVNNVNETL